MLPIFPFCNVLLPQMALVTTEEGDVKALLQISKKNSTPDPILMSDKTQTLRADKQNDQNSKRRAS